jgi:cytochrome-b5 reductase
LRKSIADLSLQSFRKYSAEAPKAAESAPKPAPKKANLTPVYVAVGLAGAAAGFYRYSTGAVAEPKNRPKAFNGQDWIDLKVAGVETLSHNTKKIRFAFDDEEAVGGLPVACQSPTRYPNSDL